MVFFVVVLILWGLVHSNERGNCLNLNSYIPLPLITLFGLACKEHLNLHCNIILKSVGLLVKSHLLLVCEAVFGLGTSKNHQHLAAFAVRLGLS